MGFYDWGSIEKPRFLRIHPCIRLLYFQSVKFVLDTPYTYGKSSSGGQLNRTTGISPLRGSLQAAPTCCDGSRQNAASTLDFMAGQEYRPIACYRRTGGNPIFIAGGFSLIVWTTDNQANNKCDPVSCVFHNDIMAQPLMWLPLITVTMGMCLMNGYSVFKEHREVKRKDLSLYLPLSERSDNH